MSKKSNLKPLVVAAGAAFVTSLASTTVANAAANPFAMSELSSGYMIAEMAEGKCGEGKCGASKATEEAKTMKEGKCGEGKCGGTMTTDKASEEAAGAAKTMQEGKCGEGKCGASK